MLSKPKKLEDRIYYDPKAPCDNCHKLGSFVYYTGDTFCAHCMGIEAELAKIIIMKGSSNSPINRL